MTKFAEIFESAIDNHGIITSHQARELGITNNELVQYACRGKIQRVGQGVYTLVQRMSEASDLYAIYVALVGDGAYLYGESVLALHGLTSTNPTRIFVATSKRVRRALPDNLRVVCRSHANDVTTYDSIPSQSVFSALRSCAQTMLPERLHEAISSARNRGLITGKEFALLAGELEIS